MSGGIGWATPAKNDGWMSREPSADRAFSADFNAPLPEEEPLLTTGFEADEDILSKDVYTFSSADELLDSLEEGA